ncbi:hypothetical protein MBANPS3_001741 [Mucor bainieri]
MSVAEKMKCPECQVLITNVDTIDTGECPRCSAFLVNLFMNATTSNTSKRKASPGLFDDITFSDDESLDLPRPSKARCTRVALSDSSDDDELQSTPSPKGRSKRKQVALSDSSDDEWDAPTTSNKTKTTERGRKQQMYSMFDSDEETMERGKKQQMESLFDSDEEMMERGKKQQTESSSDPDELWDAVDHTSNFEKEYDPSFSSGSGSEYHQSDSEDDTMFEDTETKHEQEEEPGPLKRVARANKPVTVPTRSVSPLLSSSPLTVADPSESSTSLTTAPRSNRAYSFIQFNKEMRGKLSKENPGLAPKDLSQLLSNIWNKLSTEEKAMYANKTMEPKRINPPSGNGYILFKKEMFPRIQKEFKLKGKGNDMNSVIPYISLRWSGLEPNIKATYTLRAKKIREDWALEHPREYEAYMNNMKAKVSNTKKRKRQIES